MNYEIHPLKGVGEIEFGMSPEVVRAQVHADFQSFKRSAQAAHPCDYFPSLSAFFYYDAAGLLEAIEFAAPAKPSVDGIELMSLSFEQAIAKLAAMDKHVEIEVDGAIAYQLGVSIYAPLAKDKGDVPVESVLAFRQGYYY